MIATGLVSAGAKVYITGRTAEMAREIAREINPEMCIGLAAELSHSDGISALVKTIAKAESSLNILVNNAGLHWIEPLDSFSERGWSEVLDTNLKAPFFLTQGLLPYLGASATPTHPARILNIGSVGGLHTSLVENYSYAASKAGLHHLTRVMAKWLAPRHITVNAIAPGAFPSKAMARVDDDHREAIAKQMPLARLGSTEDMAGTAIYLCSRAGAYVTGSVLAVDGGILAAV